MIIGRKRRDFRWNHLKSIADTQLCQHYREDEDVLTWMLVKVCENSLHPYLIVSLSLREVQAGLNVLQRRCEQFSA